MARFGVWARLSVYILAAIGFAGCGHATGATDSDWSSVPVSGGPDTDIAPPATNRITSAPVATSAEKGPDGRPDWVEGPMLDNPVHPGSLADAAASIGVTLALPPSLPAPDRIEVNQSTVPVAVRALAARFADAAGRYWWLRIDPWDPAVPPDAILARDAAGGAWPVEVGRGYPATADQGNSYSPDDAQVHEVRDGREWSFYSGQVPIAELVQIAAFVNGGSSAPGIAPPTTTAG